MCRSAGAAGDESIPPSGAGPRAGSAVDCSTGAAVAAAAPVTGGHGSPPATRGKPRRIDVVAADCEATGAGSGAASATSGTAAAGGGGGSVSIRALCALLDDRERAGALLDERERAGALLDEGAGEDSPPAATATSDTGGHGSPPGTRGSPRRTATARSTVSPSAPRAPR